MITSVARALVRRLRESENPVDRAGIRAALIVGGFDPDRLPPDTPINYNERSVSEAMANDPAYLTGRELRASIEAREAAMGEPF